MIQKDCTAFGMPRSQIITGEEEYAKDKTLLSALLCGAILITGTLAGVSVRTDAAASSYAVQLRAAGFPDSYISALSALHTAYPQWQFQAVKTGLDWNTVVSKESVNGVNLVRRPEMTQPNPPQTVHMTDHQCGRSMTDLRGSVLMQTISLII